MQIQSLGQEDPLEEGRAMYSSILTRKIPWTEEPGGLQSTGLHRVGHDWTHTLHYYYSSSEKSGNLPQVTYLEGGAARIHSQVFMPWRDALSQGQLPPPGDLPNPGIEPRSPALQADFYHPSHQGSPRRNRSGWSSPSPEDLPDPGIKPGFPALQVDSSPSELPGKPLFGHTARP